MASSSSSRPPSLISSSPTSSDSLSPLSTPTEPNAFPILPKLALNTQIESTLSPWLRWQIALRNGIPLPRKYKNYTSLLRTYAFDPAKSRDETKDVSNTDDVYCGSSSLFAPCRYRGVEVLRLAADFYDLAMCYFEACNSQNVRYTELFFNVHAHVRRGVPISTVMAGFSRAKADAERRFGIRSLWILCFSGHISPECAIELYNDCRPWNHMLIAGVGVDAHDTWVSPHQRSQHADSLQDKLHRPSVVFASLFSLARQDGLKISKNSADVDARERAMSKHKGFWEEDEITMQRYFIRECLASDDVKRILSMELDRFEILSMGLESTGEKDDAVIGRDSGFNNGNLGLIDRV